MRKEVLIKKFNQSIVSGLLCDGEILEFDVNEESDSIQVGDIYTGKVKNIVPNIQGAFVEIKDQQLCFYPLDERTTEIPLRIDDEILVQIKKNGTKEKKPLVTENIELSGEFVVLTGNKSFVGVSNKITSTEIKSSLKALCKKYITKDFGFIIRTSAADASQEAIEVEMQKLIDRYEEMQQKAMHLKPFQYVGSVQHDILKYCFGLYANQVDGIITDDEDIKDAFIKQEYPVKFLEIKDNSLNRMYRMEHYISQALAKKVWLKSGGFLVIEKTEAMTVIDVNSGKSIGKGNKEQHLIKINQEAAKEIARQLRLRNISGIIMIDFIDMKEDASQEGLLRKMKQYTRQDSKKVTVLDITKLGLMEVTRKKEKVSLGETSLKQWFQSAR